MFFLISLSDYLRRPSLPPLPSPCVLLPRCSTWRSGWRNTTIFIYIYSTAAQVQLVFLWVGPRSLTTPSTCQGGRCPAPLPFIGEILVLGLCNCYAVWFWISSGDIKGTSALNSFIHAVWLEWEHLCSKLGSFFPPLCVIQGHLLWLKKQRGETQWIYVSLFHTWKIIKGQFKRFDLCNSAHGSFISLSPTTNSLMTSITL